MVVALAGRRIDSPDAKQRRFPPENVAQVHDRIAAELKRSSGTALVCSAACGADLLALEAALALNIACYIVLPFDPGRFRKTSVTDRPGEWGEQFDRVLGAGRVEQLDNLGLAEDDPNAYLITNTAILDRAKSLAADPSEPVFAFIVWDQQARDQQDITLAFREQAEARGFQIRDIPTL